MKEIVEYENVVLKKTLQNFCAAVVIWISFTAFFHPKSVEKMNERGRRFFDNAGKVCHYLVKIVDLCHELMKIMSY